MQSDRRGKALTRSLWRALLGTLFLFILIAPFIFAGGSETPSDSPLHRLFPNSSSLAPGEGSSADLNSSPADGSNQPSQASPAAASGQEFPFTVLANTWNREKDRLYASGNVEIQYRNLKLFADEVEANTETKDIFARGNVVIQMPDEVVSGDEISGNLDSRQFRIEHAYGMVQPDIFYEADVIERKAEDTYSFTKARLTSCTQPTPRWKFSCARANFKKNDYVEMWSSVFAIKKVPVFYMPYFRYPLDRERSTGFLMPQIGYSGVKGFFYGQSFYWAMARNMDATITADYYGARGLGGGLEYRYLFRGGTGGEAQVYYFTFKRDETGEEPPNAYLFRLKHNQPLPFDFKLVANVDYQASLDFLREFDNNFKRATVSNFRSEAYITRAWSYYNFSLRAARYESYYTYYGISDSIITYYLPQVTLNSFKIKLFPPLYFSFYSDFTSWKYGWRSEFDVGREKYFNSVNFSPTLSLPFSKIPWLTLDASVSSNLSYYAQSYAPGTRRIIDEPLFLANYNFGAELVGPVFYKIFLDAQGKAKTKHLIEPYVSYRYDSPVSQPERIITPYGYFRYHQISYGLTNRILVKADMPREVFTWGLGQTYYLSPEDSPLSIYNWEGEIPRYSDISSYMRFYPARKFSFDASSGYNKYYKTFSFVRLGANINSYTDPFFLSVSWYKSMNPWYKNILGDRHQIGVSSRVSIPRLGLELWGDFDFNVMERKMLYSGVSLVYHYQCLDFKADVRVFYYREQPEVQYRVSFGLGNIGKTTDFLGGLGF